jgi:hypothetical protein
MLPLASFYLDFKLKPNWVWLKIKIDSSPKNKALGPGPGHVLEKNNSSGPGLCLDMPAAS